MFILIVVAIVSSYDLHQTPQEIEQEINEKVLYFGSTVRLEHQQSEYFLHSHQVQYGSGSGQQSVTGMRTDHDYNSLWTFKECWNTTLKKYDDQIKCGDCVRLEHMLTTKNLHSHFHQSPISGNQEVSAYGDNGNGDGADDWILECDGVSNDGQSQLSAKNWFQLKHKMTGKYLRASRKDIYNQRNCGYHCPIEGQLEISASLAKSPETRWKVYAGLFYLPIEKESDCNEYGDCDDIDSDDDEYRTVDL